MASLLDRIDPASAQMMLYGMGLLGSKRRDQADRYIGGLGGVLSAAGERKARQAELAEQRGYDEPLRNLQIDKLRAEIEALQGGFTGTGFNAQAFKLLPNLAAKMKAGEPLSQQEQYLYKMLTGRLSQPTTITGADGSVYQQPGLDLSYLPQMGATAVPVGAGDSGAVPGNAPVLISEAQTPGGKKVDQAFADEYVKWTTGGYADVQKGLGQLAESLGNLESGKVETGDAAALISSIFPDEAVSFFRPDFMDTKETVEEVVQRNLRLILGSQFTAKEGERLIARAYNPNLETSQNARRIQRLIKSISDAASAKQEAMLYFKENGTMDGFEGKLWTKADFNPDALFSDESPEGTVYDYNPETGQIERR